MKNKYTVQRPNMDVFQTMKILLYPQTKKDIVICELGCNEGINLHALHSVFPDFTYVGIDYCDEAIQAGMEKYREVDFIIQDIEQSAKIPNAEPLFDYILLPDILEHLNNPLQALKWTRSILKPGGVTVSCIPNLMHVSVMYDLLKYGLFTYTDVGLLDSDHKHLFTRESINAIFKTAGFEIDSVLRSTININGLQGEFIGKLCDLSNGFIPAEDFETFEYIVVTKPKEEENE